MFKKIITICTLTILLTACGGELKLDGSSPEAFQSSVDKVMAQLTPEEREAFQKSIIKIAFGVTLMGSFSDGRRMDKEKIQEEVIKIVNGKTAKQVIEMGK